MVVNSMAIHLLNNLVDNTNDEYERLMLGAQCLSNGQTTSQHKEALLLKKNSIAQWKLLLI